MSLGCTEPSGVFVSVTFSGDCRHPRHQDWGSRCPQGAWRRARCLHPPPRLSFLSPSGVPVPKYAAGEEEELAPLAARPLPGTHPLAPAPIPSLAAPHTAAGPWLGAVCTASRQRVNFAVLL